MTPIVVKKNLTQSLVLMAVMAAINIIVSVVAAFSVIASVFLIILLPLTSTIIAVFCRTRYFPIYAVSTIGLSLVATLWNFDMTLFYIVPSVITGFVFGFTLKRGYHFGWAIGISALLQAGLSLLFIPILNAIFNIDFIHDLLVIFKISNEELGRHLVPSIFFAYSLIQALLSYFVVSNEMKKFWPEAEEAEELRYFTGIGSIISISIVGFAFVNLGVAYLILLISFYFGAITVFTEFKKKHYKTIIAFTGVLLINVFLSAIFYQKLPTYYGILIMGVTPACICLISMTLSFLQKKKKTIE